MALPDASSHAFYLANSMSAAYAMPDLQVRLAQRLQETRAVPRASTHWLALQVGQSHFLLALQQAGEIFAWQEPLHVPYTQPWFRGVVNLRGTLTGVVDVAGLHGKPRVRQGRGEEPSHLVALHDDFNVNAALMADRLLGLRSDQELSLQSVSGTDPWLRCYVDGQGLQWQALDLAALAQASAFLHVSV